MSLLTNKKSILMIIITLILTIMVGCSSTTKPSNDSADNSKSNGEIVDNNKSNGSDSSGTSDSGSSDTSDQGATSSDKGMQKAILDNIKKSAEAGKVINCDFPLVNTTLQDIEKKWGKADKSDWVADAKGLYSTYSKYNVVFGTNKGDQVFEVRSFDNQLNKIAFSDVKNFFGNPQHDVTSNGEEIIGYVFGKEYKLLFVFKESTKSNNDPILDHYSVLYPSGTRNNMSGDLGREW